MTGRGCCSSPEPVGRRDVDPERHRHPPRQDHLLVAARGDLGDGGGNPVAVAARVRADVDARGSRRSVVGRVESGADRDVVGLVAPEHRDTLVVDSHLHARHDQVREHSRRRHPMLGAERVGARFERQPSQGVHAGLGKVPPAPPRRPERAARTRTSSGWRPPTRPAIRHGRAPLGPAPRRQIPRRPHARSRRTRRNSAAGKTGRDGDRVERTFDSHAGHLRRTHKVLVRRRHRSSD